MLHAQYIRRNTFLSDRYQLRANHVTNQRAIIDQFDQSAALTVGQAANVAADAAALADYRRRKLAITLRNHGAGRVQGPSIQFLTDTVG